jgi:hypothetical protein
LPAEADKVELAMFEASTSLVVGSGLRIWFWRDKWVDGRSIKSLAPDLMSAVDKRAIRVHTMA